MNEPVIRRLCKISWEVPVLAAALGILAASCTRSPERIETSALNEELWVLFTSQRRLVLDPIGCQFGTTGGTAREGELARRLRQEYQTEPLILSAGTAFIPFDPDFDTPVPGPEAAEKLVEAWNRLRLAALSPSVRDLKLGLPRLRQLASQARFPFLASNLVDSSGKFIFDRYAERQVASRELLIVGLLDPEPGFEGKGIIIRDPIRTLEDILKERGEGKMVIVLSSLGGKLEAELVRRVRGIHLLLSAGPFPAGYFTDGLISSPVLFGRPDIGGTQVFVAQLPKSAGLGTPYNLQQAENVALSRGAWLDAVKSLETKLRKTTSRKERKALREEIRPYVKSLERYPEKDLAPAPLALTYRPRYVPLDSSYDPETP